MKKTNKKLLVALSVLATPFVVENLEGNNVANANNTYNLTQSVNVYNNAQNATKQVNSSKTYATGTYYVYKEHAGMINISKTPGKPGAWINPATNKPVAAQTTVAPQVQTTNVTPVGVPATTVTTPVTTQAPVATQKSEVQENTQPTKTTAKGNTYTLNNTVKTYSNAAAAKTQRGSRTTYTSGNYFIFKEFNGMMNISRAAGKAGAWINPVENKVIAAKPTTTNPTTSQKPAEIKPVEVKPAETKPVETTTVVNANTGTSGTPATQEAKAGSTYILKSRTNIYNTAVDAKNSANSKNTYGEGTYYVYKTYNGMINISRTRGRVGAWINPLAGTSDVSKTSQPASVIKPEKTGTENVDKETEIVQYETASKEVVYYNQDDPSWKNKKYGRWTMGHTACVPTSLAMAISTLGTTVTPIEVADILHKSGHYNGRGGLGTFSSGLPAVFEKFGVKYKKVTSKADLKTELEKGGLVYATVDGTPFVNAGYSHAMIVKGIDSKGNAKVYNPLSRLGIKDYSLDTIWNKKSKMSANLSLGAPMLVLYK